MKKLLSVIALLTVVSFAVNAQGLKSKKGENYLPEKGDWSIGFNMDGVFSYVGNTFNGTSNNSAPSVDFLSNTTFVGKIYTSDKTATRYTANLGISSDKAGDVSTSSFDITAGYGKEWRKGKTRLQGFYGADALISAASSSSKNGSTTLYKSGMALGVGVNGFLGAEYFIFPKISLGAQYNYGIGFISQAKGEGTGPTESSSEFALGGVGVNGGSINVNLHF